MRTFFLIGLGLLLGLAAAAQPTAAAPPDSPDFLLGLVLGLLGLVALAVVLTGVVVSVQLKHRRQQLAENSTATAAPERRVSAC